MISKVTESNKNLIEARIAEINKGLWDSKYNPKLREIAADIKNPTEEEIAEATAWANEKATVIDSFESYFANILEISELATNFHSAPYKFFLMPLDEPLFEIDANKRSITIPSDFNKNGVGVRGDHMAETLYFRIDRYFDHQDLYNVDEIVINWQFRPSNASRNADLPVNTSLALAPDETYDPGHIVFGWVIDKNMTPSKGTLSFSIGFLKRENNQYLYALNTTMASVNVNDALVLEDPSVLNNLSRPVFERLTNSRYDEDGITPLADPTFRSGDVIVENEVPVQQGLKGVANFELKEDGSEEEKLVLTAIGHAIDDGTVTYLWHGTEFASGEVIERPANSATILSDYVKTEDAHPVEGIAYYIIEDGEVKPLSDTSVPTVGDAFDDVNLDVFELGSSLEIKEAGTYQVTAQSVKSVGQPGLQKITVRSGNVESKACVVPCAAVPAVELSATSVVTPETASPAFYVVEGEEDVFAQYTFIEGAAPIIKANVSIDENGMDASKGIVEESSLGALAFKLVKSADEKPAEEELASFDYTPFVEGALFDVVKPLIVNAAKLAVAPADENAEASQANQDLVNIMQVGNTVVVYCNKAELNSFASTNPNQGTAKWIGIDLATNLDSIAGATWGNYVITEADVEESASVGLGDGHIIYWAKADAIEAAPAEIVIGAAGFEAANLKVMFVDGTDVSYMINELSNEADDFVEGDYCVYGINRRNHTYSISEISNEIHISKIAPAMTKIGVAVENNNMMVNLIVNNRGFNEATIALDDTHASREFEISIGDEIDEEVNMIVNVVEIKSKENYKDAVTGMAIRKGEADGDVIDVFPTGDIFTCTIGDSGYYVVEVITQYHGTQRVTLSEPFTVYAV